MRLSGLLLACVFLLFGPHALARYDTVGFWGVICGLDADAHADAASLVAFSPAGLPAAALPAVAKCSPAPTAFQELPSVGSGGDTNVNLAIGYDPDTQRLCYVATGLPMAPVIRVGVGHRLDFTLTNTLQNGAAANQINCPIDSYGGEGPCVALPQFRAAPGGNGTYYPLMANQAHAADGTSNLHVHGLMVTPKPCSDEVLGTTLYPADWRGKVGRLLPCQTAPNGITYEYDLPSSHPAGLYWYHTHRHGQAEHQTQMGLAGAIVVEDAGDTYRASIGVHDEVLLVDDAPIAACIVGPSCDRPRQPRAHRALAAAASRAAAREAARTASTTGSAPQALSGPTLDPRIDQADQAGTCAAGATGGDGVAGGTELWNLTLNGAPVPEGGDGSFPPDDELLAKTMQPGQRLLFRLANASANSFLAPKLVLSQGGQQTVLPLEVFARDGVGLAGASGARHLTKFDVQATQFILPPAGRVEFVVHAPPAGAILYLQSDQVMPGCAGNEYPARRLLRITSAGTPVAPGAADDSDLLLHTPSLAAYLKTQGSTATVHRTFVLSEYGRDFTYGKTKWLSGPPSTAQYDPEATDFFITEVASDDGEVDPARTAVVPFVMNAAQPPVLVHLHGEASVTEEWLIENSTLEIHDFHIHQIHFRDVSIGSSDPDAEPILDSINVPAAPLMGDVSSGYPGAPGWVRLRMTFTRQDIGTFVFHCHILEHEDNGMMQRVQVVAQ